MFASKDVTGESNRSAEIKYAFSGIFRKCKAIYRIIYNTDNETQSLKHLLHIAFMLVFKSTLNKFPWCKIFKLENKDPLGSIYRPP